MDWTLLFGRIDFVAMASTAIAVLSLVFNFIVVRRQSVMQRESVRIQADAAVFSWGRECVAAISRAIEYSDYPGGKPDIAAERAHLRWTLSSLLDEGRMFFPNDDATGEVQMGKNSGWRPAVLDAVAFAYFIIRDEEKFADRLSERGPFLKECRRLFYSEIQRATEPKQRARMLGRLRGERRGDGMNDFQRALAQRLETLLPGTLERFQPSSPTA